MRPMHARVFEWSLEFTEDPVNPLLMLCCQFFSTSWHLRSTPLASPISFWQLTKKNLLVNVPKHSIVTLVFLFVLCTRNIRFLLNLYYRRKILQCCIRGSCPHLVQIGKLSSSQHLYNQSLISTSLIFRPQSFVSFFQSSKLEKTAALSIT